MAANTHLWASHVTAGASSQDPSFRSSKWSYSGMDLLLKLGLGVWPGGTGRSSPWFPLWLDALLPTMEALLH